jgi:hypothetical protein
LRGHTDIRTAGVKAGAKSFVLLNQNMVTPQASSGNWGKRLARVADRFAGRGCWKKRLLARIWKEASFSGDFEIL